MKKLIDFCTPTKTAIIWTLEYFVFLYFILQFLFGFNLFSYRHWWIFLHATLHGFGGFTFGVIMYSALPIYIATLLIILRKNTKIIETPEIIEKIFTTIGKIFVRPAPKEEPVITAPTTPEPTNDQLTPNTVEYPSDMPPELRAAYLRAKQNRPLASNSVSTFNKQQPVLQPQPTSSENESFPIPTDFDISDSLPDNATPNFSNDFPVFKDIDFDTPLEQPKELSNSVTKYLKKNNIEYETYRDFVATNKYLIYDHNDGDFWIMDEDTWFASKKQRESPIREMIDLARQNNLIPVLYLESQNIMDLPGTTERFESMGVRVIRGLDELE